MQAQFLSWKIPWRKVWKSIPVFLPGESHGQRSLAGYGPQGYRVRSDLAQSIFQGLLRTVQTLIFLPP